MEIIFNNNFENFYLYLIYLTFNFTLKYIGRAHLIKISLKMFYLRNEANFDVLYTIYCNLGQFNYAYNLRSGLNCPKFTINRIQYVKINSLLIIWLIELCLTLFEEYLERKCRICMTRTNIVDAKKLHSIVTPRQVIVYDMKNFAKVKWTNQILCYKQN
jgi:hypothetical protein